MKKMFISQPMNGKTEEEILREREAAIETQKKIFGDELEVIDSYFEDFPVTQNVKNVPLKFLAKGIDLLAEADIAIFLKGWENARGCKIEYECAREYGLTIIKWSGKNEY